jgi:hypothetical protein
MRRDPHPGVQRLYQHLFHLVARLQSNGSRENKELRHAVRDFFTRHRDEIRTGLDAFFVLPPALKDLTAKMQPVNPIWRTWIDEIESTFVRAVGDPKAEAELRRLEEAVGLEDLPKGPDVSLFPSGYEAIERALRYAAYWTPGE